MDLYTKKVKALSILDKIMLRVWISSYTFSYIPYFRQKALDILDLKNHKENERMPTFPNTAVGQTVIMNPDGSTASSTTDMGMPSDIRYSPEAYTGWAPAGQEGMMYAGNTPSYNAALDYYRAFNESTGAYDYWQTGGLTGQESINPKTPIQGPGGTPEYGIGLPIPGEGIEQGPGMDDDPQWKAGILPGGQPAAGYGSPAWVTAQGGGTQEGIGSTGVGAQAVSQEMAQSQAAQSAYNQPTPSWSYQATPMYAPFGGANYSMPSARGYGGGGYYGAPQQSAYGGYGGYGGGGYGGYGGGYMPSAAPPMGGYYGGYGMGGGGYGGGYSPMSGLLNLLGQFTAGGGQQTAEGGEAAQATGLNSILSSLGGLFGGK